MLMTSSHFIYQMAVINKICPRVELLAASKFKKREEHSSLYVHVVYKMLD